MMEELIEYIVEHTERGECRCGLCLDKGPDRDAPGHSVDVHFFWVSARNGPTRSEFEGLLSLYPDRNQLRDGPSYIAVGAALGSQDIALRFLGLGELVGSWKVITPESMGATGEAAKAMAGSGFVMCSGFGASV
jgi:hypothetical protein